VIKQLLHKTFSIGMALVVLFSTISFTIEKHFCGDTLVDVAVFSEPQYCGDIMGVVNATIENKSCCKDETTVVEGQNELLVKAFDDLELEQQVFLTTFAYTHINLFEGLPQQVIPYKNYSPPSLVIDKQIMDQVFLI